MRLDEITIDDAGGAASASHTVRAEDPHLRDHFTGFPILPGVLMLEAMVETARRLLARRDPALARAVLGTVRATKYGAMVPPGATLRVEVALTSEPTVGVYEFKGVGMVLDPGDVSHPNPRTAVSGRFSLRSIGQNERDGRD